jgi:peptidoglycan/LPS O-acetylase OafA/YrhL
MGGCRVPIGSEDSLAPRAAYRPDIDGLRAIAVAAVVAFHAAPSLVPGGYVGVDVFFVISGFLITQIIASQRDAGRFRFVDFYRRRARRILPAYFTVTAVIAVAAAIILLPRDLKMFGGALGASSLFLANLWFGHGFGYFQPASREAPLLHLWSLAVEEQFYLVWPLLIAGLSLRRIRRFRPVLMLLLAAASLAFAAWLVSRGVVSQAFYYLPARAWEFLCGGLLAVGLCKPPKSALTANASAIAGVLMIAASLILLNSETPFPGLAALAPCIGAALVIWSGQGAAPTASAWLRSPPMVGLGRVSYSLYLWHWPVLVLARQVVQQPLAPWQTLALMLLALGLAILTWRFVERPWRENRPRWSHLGLAIGAAALLFAVGLAELLSNGFPGRIPNGVVLEETDINPMRASCLLWGPAPRELAPPPDCIAGAAKGAVLVWGDSHADGIAPGVLAWARAHGLQLRQATRAGCAPLLDTRVVTSGQGDDPACTRFNTAVLRTIAAEPDIRFVVLSARWPLYLNALPRMAYYDPPMHIEDASEPPGRVYPLGAALGHTLGAIAASGSKARIVVVGAVPELPFSVPACVAQASRFHLDEKRCEHAPSGDSLARATLADRQIEQALSRRPAVGSIFPASQLCTAAACATVMGGDMLYYDADHLSASGARKLLPGWLDTALSTGGEAR